MRTPCFWAHPAPVKSHLAQAIGLAAIQQGYRVLYRETHTLLSDIAEATLDGTRKEDMELLSTIPLLIIDDLGMRKLPPTAAEELLEIVMRRYERTSTLLTSNRPVEDWGKLLGVRPAQDSKSELAYVPTPPWDAAFSTRSSRGCGASAARPRRPTNHASDLHACAS
jgi:IstB-like ATP binding protein